MIRDASALSAIVSSLSEPQAFLYTSISSAGAGRVSVLSRSSIGRSRPLVGGDKASLLRLLINDLSEELIARFGSPWLATEEEAPDGDTERPHVEGGTDWELGVAGHTRRPFAWAPHGDITGELDEAELGRAEDGRDGVVAELIFMLAVWVVARGLVRRTAGAVSRWGHGGRAIRVELWGASDVCPLYLFAGGDEAGRIVGGSEVGDLDACSILRPQQVGRLDVSMYNTVEMDLKRKE
jgi:hypothetical protein